MPRFRPDLSLPDTGPVRAHSVKRTLCVMLTAVALAMSLLAIQPAVGDEESNTGAVFYSGDGCAGLGEAGGAVRRLRESWLPCVPFTGGVGVYNGRWTGSERCDPSHATFPSEIDGTTISQLVGFSLGRLGPLYFLAAANQDEISKIHTILLLDPGSSSIASNPCDQDPKLNVAGNLRDWLSLDPENNRLVIMAGRTTAADDYAGIRQAYLRELPEDISSNQVFVCYADLGHDAVMTRYRSMIGSRFSGACPEESERVTNLVPGGPAGATSADDSGSGEAAPSPLPPTPTPSVGLTQGPEADQGYRYNIRLNGFPAGSSVDITCHDSADPAGFFDFILTVDQAGNASTASYCYSADGPDHWVIAGGVESNHVAWGAASGPAITTSTTWTSADSAASVPLPEHDDAPAVTTSTTSAPTPTPATPPVYEPTPSAVTYPQTTGGAANTWTNYSNAGGTQGPTIPSNATVEIACKVRGFTVEDGNPWWYRIASSPWDDRFYVSADVFYNNGATSGSLRGTPFVDTSVPDC